MLTVFKTILSNSNISDEQNNTLTCIWNLCFDDKVSLILARFASFIQAKALNLC